VHLAIAGKTSALVSGDRDLLALAGARGLCAVMSVSVFCERVLAD
jgi:predicted nucleic acid-binding protein